MIIFISNYYNHHQAPFSEEIYKITDGEYRFISTTKINEGRIKLGWSEVTAPYVLAYEKNPEECRKLIDNADVVIFGSAPYSLLESRLKAKKLTFVYSERIYKQKKSLWKLPWSAIKLFLKFGRCRKCYLLCASAYAAQDYCLSGVFIGKTYKWGYFPRLINYVDINSLMDNKQPQTILWVARFIDWKHPEIPIEIAKRLKDDGYKFSLDMIGTGVLEEKIKQLVSEYNLQGCVNLLGAMDPDTVRTYMDKASIFMFTSDRNEGWGAVLNESMNSGCAVVASHAIGSVPFLIKDKENGFIYRNGDFDDLYVKVKYLLDNPEQAQAMGIRAYRTMIDEWNAENAANRLIELSKSILNGEKYPVLYKDGPCSKAFVIRKEK